MFWLRNAFFFLVLVFLSGIILRFQWMNPQWMLFNQKFLVHAHSHIAMLGWLNWFIFAWLSFKFKVHFPCLFRGIFWILTLSVIPLFIMDGYWLGSIAVSSLYLVLSYWILWKFNSQISFVAEQNKHIIKDGKFFSYVWSHALIWYFISTLGPWALGGSVKWGADYMDFWIRYYLHLQFNGWFTFMIIAVLVSRISLSDELKIKVKRLITFASITVAPALFPIQKLLDNFLLEILGRISVVIYALSIFWILWIIYKASEPTLIFRTGILFGFLKQILVLSTLFTFFSDMAKEVHEAKIAYTHVALLGFISTLMVSLVLDKTNRVMTLIWIFGTMIMLGGLLLDVVYPQYQLIIGISRQTIYFVWGLILLIPAFTILTSLFKKDVTNPL